MQEHQASARKTVSGFICLLLLGGILFACLVPFHAPANQVTWIAGAHAVRLGAHGTLLSTDAIPPSGSTHASRSLEIWVQPKLARTSGTLIAFYNPASPRYLSLMQDRSDLLLRIETTAAWRYARTTKIYIDDVFRDKKTAFWCITSDAGGVAIYRNGILIRRSTGIQLSGQEFSGRIITGNSPIQNGAWPGILSGLAVYDRPLTQSQVRRHYQTWTKGGKPELQPDDDCVALYLFGDYSGRVIRNSIGTGNDLYIPAKYVTLNQTTMDPVWRKITWSQWFWMDVLLNIIGFIPLGCFLCIWLTENGSRHPVLLASVLGGAISLFIELAQSQLPTRDSSMSDLISNLIGSVTGAFLYRGAVAPLIDNILARVSRILVRPSAIRMDRSDGWSET